MCDQDDTESIGQGDPTKELDPLSENDLKPMPTIVEWDSDELLANSIEGHIGMLFWEDSFKLPAGSRLVFWNAMVRALRASNFEEHIANMQAEEDAKRRGVVFPYKAPYVPIVVPGLGANVSLYRYRYGVYNRAFYLLIQMGPVADAGQRSGKVMGWFEAKGDSEISYHINRIQGDFND